ncbi:unnamed protein product, partial [Rotaria sp. Silwood1]
VTAVQQQIVNQQERRTPFWSSITQTNGTITMFNSSQRRIYTIIFCLSSTILPTITINDELINKIHTREHEENDVRHPA